MTPDRIVILNPDELFLCGRFCMWYTSQLYFYTGVNVVKPDADMFRRVRQEFARFAQPQALLQRRGPRWLGLRAPEVSCQAEHDTFLLGAFFPVEAVRALIS